MSSCYGPPLSDDQWQIVTGPHNEIKALPKDIRKGSTIQGCCHEVPSVESSGFLGCFFLGFRVWSFCLVKGFLLLFERFGALVVCLGFFVIWLVTWLVWVFVGLLSLVCFLNNQHKHPITNTGEKIFFSF